LYPGDRGPVSSSAKFCSIGYRIAVEQVLKQGVLSDLSGRSRRRWGMIGRFVSQLRSKIGSSESPLAWWEHVLWTGVSVGATCGVGGGVFGFVRGLSYLPTLPFAVIEGAVIFAVPGGILGLLIGLVVALGRLVRRTS
jgi:hypothetical protein